MVRHWLGLRVLLIVVVLGAVVNCASAGEKVEELWRSDYGVIRVSDPYRTQSTLSTSVDLSDGSVWLIAGANVLHLGEGGELLFRSEALHSPSRVAVDPSDGSCWVFEGFSNQFPYFDLLHFNRAGILMSTTPYQGEESFGNPLRLLTPSPADGSVWVTGVSQISRYDATGEEAWRKSYRIQQSVRVGPSIIYRAVVDPDDGSGWVFDGDQVVRLRADGSELWRVSGAGPCRVLAEDIRDKSVWTVLSGEVSHVSSEGSVLWQSSEGRDIIALYVSPTDDSVWVEYFDFPPETAPNLSVAEVGGNEVVHLDASGEELWRIPDAGLIALNDLDRSVWMEVGAELVHVSSNHEELHRLPIPEQILAFNPNNNSFWIIDENKLVNQGPDGTVLWEDQLLQLHQLWDSSNWVESDGSCWVADRSGLWLGADEFVHLSADGTELERRPIPDPLLTPEGLAISPFDGSWWIDSEQIVGGYYSQVLLHLDEEGFELGRNREVGWLQAIDETDGSLWTAQNSPPSGPSYLYHLTPDGAIEWAKQLTHFIGAVAVNPVDGSVWVSTSGELRSKLLRFSQVGAELSEIALPENLPEPRDLVVLPSDGSIYGVSGSGHGQGFAFRIASDGRLIWLRDNLADAEKIAVSPTDGSAWVVDLGTQTDYFSENSAVVHYAADGIELWRSTTFNLPQAIAISPNDDTVWISDWQNGQMVQLGVERLPFSDIAGDCWAWDAILACYTVGLVEGYPDGYYRPASSVTRDQMAVYIARAVAGGDASVPPGPEATSFSDVGIEHWAYDHIEYAVSQNIVEGYDDGSYQPEVEVTRDQMAVYVARALVTPSGEAGLADYVPSDPRNFPDVTDTFWAYKHIEYCVEHGVVQGYLDGYYYPDNVVTRDQMAVYVARAFELP